MMPLFIRRKTCRLEKVRKHLPQCTQMKGIYNTTLQNQITPCADAGGAGAKIWNVFPHDMPHRDKVTAIATAISPSGTPVVPGEFTRREQRREPRSSEHADVKIAETLFRPA